MSGSDDRAVIEMAPFPRAVITACCMIGTLMQALDSTIANVALPYMQGSLSASYDQITWVLTSYVIAAAIMTAPVGWLSTRFGRKNLFIACLVGFTVSSMACGIATSLVEMVIDRLIQGAFGAALVPLSQSTMLDIYKPSERGGAMALWGMGVMVGPILGPTLGGYLTSLYTWRYVFFVNLPFGIAAVLGLMFFMAKREQRPASDHFDWLGFGVLSLGLAALQLMLDRGEELDWFGSAEIIGAAIVAIIGFYLFIVHMFTAKKPFIPRVAFADRNLNSALIAMFLVGLVLLASSALLAPYLQKLGDYPVETAGLVMAPRGIGTMIAMMIAGRTVNKIDPRLMMFAGYLLLMISMWMMTTWLPSTSQTYIIETLVVQGFSMGLVFTPLQVVAFYTLDPKIRTQGTSLLSLTRNVGSAIGISVTEAVQVHMMQYNHASISSAVTPFNRALQVGGSVTHMLNPGTPQGAARLNTMIDRQASIIGYIDSFKLMMLVSIPAMFTLLLIKKPATQSSRPDQAGQTSHQTSHKSHEMVME
jgi:DHA2 family multidrug resistance protein